MGIANSKSQTPPDKFSETSKCLHKLSPTDQERWEEAIIRSKLKEKERKLNED